MKALLPPNETQRLEALRQYAVLDTSAEPAFDELAQLAAHICQTPIALVVLVDETRQWFKAKVGMQVEETSRDIGFCAHTILNSSEVLEVRDASLDPRFFDDPLVTSDSHIRFYAGVPLVTADGHALGSLCVIDRKPQVLTAEQLTALRTLGRQTIAQLELRRHAGELTKQVTENLRTGALLQQRLDELSASKQETDRLLALGKKSRRALLSVLEDEQLTGRNLRASEASLASAQQRAKIGSWELMLADKNGFWSAEMYRLFARDPALGTMNRDQFMAMIHPKDRALISRNLVQTIAERRDFQQEFRVVLPDGSVHWIESRGELTYSAAGQAVSLVGTSQDITERKQTEAALRESEARWQFALEGAGDGVWDLDVPTSTVFYSKRFKEVLGYSEAEIGTALNEWTSRIHPADVSRVMADLQPHLDGVAQHYVNEHRMRCKDGSYKWILDRGLVITRDVAGKPQRMVGTHSDITQRKQMEERLRQTANTLEQRVLERTQALHAAQLSKTRFFAAASHDLLQPLNAARIFASSLAEQRGLSDANLHIVQRIDSALLGAEEVIDVLVDVAKLDTGAVRAVIEDLDLHELLAGLTDQFSPIAERRNLQLRVGPCKVIVRSDRRLLRRVVQNLISNALRYTASGGVLVGVRRLPGAQIRVDVVDTGPGIPDESISEIFEEFRRGGHSSPWGEKGLGLGLAICMRICDLLGHKLSVNSVPGRGSIFSLSLGDFHVNTDVVSLATPIARTQFSLSQIRVLCVDDNIEVLDAMITLLRSWDVPYEQASDLSSALEAARISRPDVVIVDYQFDDAHSGKGHSGDGLQIIAALRDLYPKPPPMAIMVTANRTVALKDATKNLGIALLQKPLRAARLRSLLESASRSYDSTVLKTTDDFIG